MTDKHVDEAKGRVKEAAGALTDDQELKNEGKADQGKSTLKNVADDVAETISDATEAIKEKLS